MKKPAADSPQDLPPYRCKSHGEVEALVSYRSNGYLHRRCPLCLKERFDKRTWQRERRALARQGLPAKGRVYVPRATTADDLPPYECRRHGHVPALVTKATDGSIHRRCSVCWSATDDEFSKKWRERKAEYMRDWNRRVMLECFAAYGGCCSCCKESESAFLSIDHVNNDGAMHRRTVPGGKNIYRWLRVRGFPKEGYRLSCFNCNLGRARNGGVCPHESSLKEI